jgi:hypothetical protein
MQRRKASGACRGSREDSVEIVSERLSTLLNQLSTYFIYIHVNHLAQCRTSELGVFEVPNEGAYPSQDHLGCFTAGLGLLRAQQRFTKLLPTRGHAIRGGLRFVLSRHSAQRVASYNLASGASGYRCARSIRDGSRPIAASPPASPGEPSPEAASRSAFRHERSIGGNEIEMRVGSIESRP